MDAQEFRKFARAAVDYIADYLDTVRDRKVLSSVNPGYMKAILPEQPPPDGEPWQEILEDVDKIIMPGLTHWHSPHFHAYCPTANSYPGIVGELFLSGLGVIYTDWFSNPACVELELIMMDWLAKILNLPSDFLNSSEGPGAGVIQNAASESTLVALLTAKKTTITRVLQQHPLNRKVESKLVAYTSEQSNSSVEKSGLLASIPMKLLPTDKEGRLRGPTLLQAITEDLAKGLIPCCVVATLGTTGTCAFDKIQELGPICREYKMWLHVDAAYAGSAFACPEFRHLMRGIEFVDSFNINPHKWMLVNSDCSAMWFRDASQVEHAFSTSSKDTNNNCLNDSLTPDVGNWQIPSLRRFRALKLWFVLRIYGVEGIQKHIRHQVSLAKYFEGLVRGDDRFEVCKTSMGIVCFRLRGRDEVTQGVIDRVTARKNLFIMPYYYQGKLVIRLVICSRFTEKRDVEYAWDEFKAQSEVST